MIKKLSIVILGRKSIGMFVLALIVLSFVSGSLGYAIRYKDVIETEGKLEDVSNQLKNTEDRLTNATSSIIDMFNTLNEKTDIIISINGQLVEKTEKVTAITNELFFTERQLAENISEVELLRKGTKYNMHDPTHSEVASFIANDPTDSIKYNATNFNCNDFSAVVNNNAESLGIRCAVVYAYFYGFSHVLVGFNTLDNGMIYIEPQTDEWVNLAIGKEYWTECVVGNHTDPWYNDTIRRILTIW